MKKTNPKNQKGKTMRVLLVLNRSYAEDFRIIVRLHEKWLREKVITLLEEDKDKEAFDLMLSNAEVDSYLPKGSKLTARPQFTLIEDML